MIKIKDIKFSYDKSEFSLHIPDLIISQGEKVALVGPSGCGKTTLLYLVAGIHRPQEGEIIIGNQKLSGLTEKQLRNMRITQMGFIFQQFELLDYLNGWGNILLPNLINPALEINYNAKERVDQIAKSMGVSHLLFRYPHRISHGERQRIAICRAMFNEPDIIIADEPTGNLDTKTTSSIMDLLISQGSRRKSTFLMVTHDVTLLKFFDRVIDFNFFTDGVEK